MRLLGALLVVAGVLLLIYGGVTLFVPKDVIDLGAFTISVNENLTIPLPPILGLIFLVLGIVMMASVPAAPPPPYGRY